MLNILEELENYIDEFNQDNNEEFDIDSIRVEFSKQHKLENLRKLGEWSKLEKNSNILAKVKKRNVDNDITSVHRLEKHNIYYYNKKDDTGQYRKAEMVIFGMKQYHKAPPRELIIKLLAILKAVTNIDICLDLPFKPNIKALENQYLITPYITPKGVKTDTSYINTPEITMIEKIIIYNKAFKNQLDKSLWRIEAKVEVPNIKYLQLPLYEFKEFIDLMR